MKQAHPNLTISRRRVAQVLALSVLPSWLATTTHAQSFPNKPIELTVPYPPGGSTDVVSRALANKIGPMLGQTMIVDNRPGGNANIGTIHVARAPADGYKLLFATNAVVAINPHLHNNVGFDPFRDFAPISLVSNGALAVAVSPQLGVSSLPEFVTYVKAHPRKVFYGTPSSGTPQHLMGELLNQVAGIDMTPVHYKGIAPVITDLIGGSVQVVFSTYAALKPQADGGRVKVIAVAETKRLDLAPQIATIAETYPGFEMTTWFGIFAPAGTPKEVLARLEQCFMKAVVAPDTQQLLNSLALPPVGGGAEALARALKTDYDKFGKIVAEKHITVE